jgi:hypothetical protein
MGYFHAGDVLSPLSIILKRDNVVIATYQKHINDFCEADRGQLLEREGSPRAYRYRFRDPLMPPYVFMTAIANMLIDADQLTELWT